MGRKIILTEGLLEYLKSGKTHIDFIKDKNIVNKTDIARIYRNVKYFNKNNLINKVTAKIDTDNISINTNEQSKKEDIPISNIEIESKTTADIDTSLSNAFKEFNDSESEDKIPKNSNIETEFKDVSNNIPLNTDEDTIDLDDLGDFVPEILDFIFSSRGLSPVTKKESDKLTKHINTLITNRAPKIVSKNADILNPIKDIAIMVLKRGKEASLIIKQKKEIYEQNEKNKKEMLNIENKVIETNAEIKPSVTEVVKMKGDFSNGWSIEEFKRWRDL